MATICTKCGTALTSDAGFCPSCGAPIGAETATSQPPSATNPPPPNVYAPPATAYPVVPPKSSGGALKIVLIVIAVVGLGILAVGILGFVGYRAMHAAGNSISMGQSADVTEADLGVSVYPGAVRNPNGGMRIKTSSNLMVSALYTTGDPASSVLTYYQGQLGSREGANMVSTQSGQATTLTSATVTGTMKDSLVITVTPSPQVGTQIMILHTKTTH
jgi:hypothetical protein